MKITKLFTGADGCSHFVDIDIPLEAKGDWGLLSKPLPVKQLFLRETSADYNFNWHNAPTSQYMIMLSGEVDIEISNGTIRRFKAGDIVLLDDVEGKGHISRAVSSRPRQCVFITK